MYVAATGRRRLPRTITTVVVGLGTVVALAGAGPGTGPTPTGTSFERIGPDDPRVVPYQQHPASRIVDKDTLTLRATRNVPGFGSAYVDAETETLHVWLTEPTAQLGQDAHAALSRLSGPGGPRGTDVVTHRADYTFAQLKAWKDAAMELFARPEVVLVGISQRTNRLRVGIRAEDRLTDAFADHLASRGVPVEAVDIVRVDQGFAPQLRDDKRPLTGATQIQFQAGAGGLLTGTCTMGFVALRGGPAGFVTNAHCSRTRGSVDDGRYWQATRPFFDDNQVGTEVADPPFFAGGPCPVDFVCSFTDANFVSAHSGVPVSVGRIASVPCCNSTGWNGTDTWRISDSFFTFAGNPVRKTGRTTGTTTGTVDEECQPVRVQDTNIVMMCQDLVHMTSDPGDSGSPVFEITHTPETNDVRAVGIHWGGGVIDGVQTTVLTPTPFVSDVLGVTLCFPAFGC